MKPTQRLLTVTVVCASLAGAAMADPMSGKDAASLMFSPNDAEVDMQVVDGLPAESAALLEQVVKDYAYYAAVAIVPDADILKSEATMLVANHHSAEAAAAAALAGCNAANTTATPCVVAAIVRPKNWEPRALQLSVEGTLALQNDYGKRGERAMAASPQTGFLALAQGAGAQDAAVAACNNKGASDCAVVVADAE
ncbi:5-aminolevulic acid synthase [Pseudorhodobacter sp. W20_MBD10_FR17]|uniref:5-aminolevulic acid synthase n=1 Tax=Pseudorhodobacter sp. W20_MBD10_FR17 TaxID=3240266 RepID=UPI003F95BF0B